MLLLQVFRVIQKILRGAILTGFARAVARASRYNPVNIQAINSKKAKLLRELRLDLHSIKQAVN